MKRFCGLLVAILVSAVQVPVCFGAVIPGGHYFGQTPPGFTPEVFAPGVISLSGRYETCLVFSHNLDECVFGETNASWSYFSMWYTRMESDSTWIDPTPAPFQGAGDGVAAAFEPGANSICFASSRPAYPPMNMWMASRTESGWSDPVAMDPPINSTSDEWGGSYADDGTLYFSSSRPGGYGAGDIYRTVTGPGGEITVENLGAAVNSGQNDATPCIARDGSYLIFESNRPGGMGLVDLYISLNQGGVWTAARNLGAPINTSWFDDGAFVSPDGKYLFFNRRKSFMTTVKTDIWWVDARAALDPSQSDVGDQSEAIGEQTILRNAPNPFSPSTTITYSIPSPGFVTMKIYDVLGREVESLVNTTQGAGTYSVKFDGQRADRPASGVYTYSLRLGDRELGSRKMVALR